MFQLVWVISFHTHSRSQCTYLFQYASNYQPENASNETISNNGNNKKDYRPFSLPMLHLLQENISNTRSKNSCEPRKLKDLQQVGLAPVPILFQKKKKLHLQSSQLWDILVTLDVSKWNRSFCWI